MANPTGPLISQVAVSQAKGRISWNCFDTQGVKSSSIQIDGKAAANVYGPYKASSGVNFSAPLSSMAAGPHTYTITATDGAGNVSTLTGSFTWGSSRRPKCPGLRRRLCVSICPTPPSSIGSTILAGWWNDTADSGRAVSQEDRYL